MATEKPQLSKANNLLTILKPLISQLDRADIYFPADEDYALHSATFSAREDLHPAVVFAPSSTGSLAKIVKFLYKSDLDFNIRGQGFRSPSSRDVLLSLLKFKDFEYDQQKKLATVGVGATWVEVAEKMLDADPQFSVPVARTPSVGVGGSILHGGISWMTSELGFISDPNNFINAEVVKYDGSIVMAADEPDLMWSLRGSGGGFGIMTKVVLRAHYYPTNIWSGMILIPRRDLPEVAQRITQFISKPQHPRVNFLVYSVREKLMRTILSEKDLQSVQGDMIAIHVYDALGESHGREVFRWALEIPGAIDRTSVVNMKGVVDMQQNAALLRGIMTNFYAIPMAVADTDAETIVRAMEWQDKIQSIDQDIGNQTMVVLEFLVLSPPAGDPTEVALPRRLDDKHYLLVITGCPVHGTVEQERKAREIAVNIPNEVFGESQNYIILPSGLDKFHNPKKTYGMHWEKLVELRKRYDPDLKFAALINP